MMLCRDILGDNGPFMRHVPGFIPRTQQQEMAVAVADCLEDNAVLIAEAGTGTGKTYAYLVPALMSGKKLIISTGTRNLQDQLFLRDLPMVRQALAVSTRTALLKGRSNYLCLHRLQHHEHQASLGSRQQVREFQLIRRWAQTTHSGDIAELTGIAEHSPVWPLVTSTSDNCLGKDCPVLGDCHVMQARRLAQEAEVVVINHHLYFADMALRDDGFAELLPGAHGVIFDEAHLLPEVAADFFGISLGSGQLLELAGDAITAQLSEAPDTPQLSQYANRLQTTVSDLRLNLGETGQRAPYSDVSRSTAFCAKLSALKDALQELGAALEQVAERGKALEQCRNRWQVLRERLETLTAPSPDNHVHWLETHKRNFVLRLTPLDIGDIFHEHIYAGTHSWVFTSATLAVKGGFEHFTRTLGLDKARTHCWNSPFDYHTQTLLYLPAGLPDPSSVGYNRALIEAMLPVLQASRGRAFILTTSHRALQEYAALLQGVLDFPVLVQGDMPRAQLLARFAALGNAILVGTSSFWEGVDVRGEALSCVIIDRLPFASPGDPVLSARIERIRRQGGNPFRDYQLPQAVIELKQGAGRLIRDVHDRGVLVLCDPRLQGRSYGSIFLKSLPPMPLTRRLPEVQAFFAAEQKAMPATSLENPAR
ncbi:MAG: helicase [Gammaproteobacteria bacterium RBG_16_57_12]|nr:MAG: helicase [Gammaproteobacteria bacterium RBG_16_57_12]